LTVENVERLFTAAQQSSRAEGFAAARDSVHQTVREWAVAHRPEDPAVLALLDSLDPAWRAVADRVAEPTPAPQSGPCAHESFRVFLRDQPDEHVKCLDCGALLCERCLLPRAEGDHALCAGQPRLW
jgi:hypothetical protein